MNTNSGLLEEKTVLKVFANCIRYKELALRLEKFQKDVFANILKELGYSLLLNQKMLQIGEKHPDRDKQFRFILNSACFYSIHFVKRLFEFFLRESYCLQDCPL